MPFLYIQRIPMFFTLYRCLIYCMYNLFNCVRFMLKKRSQMLICFRDTAPVCCKETAELPHGILDQQIQFGMVVR